MHIGNGSDNNAGSSNVGTIYFVTICVGGTTATKE